MDKKKIIEKAQNSFNKDLLSKNYPQIHYDDNHLELLLNEIKIYPNNNYLDLGTGNGYIAFSLANKSPEVNVYGIDIANEAIKNNFKISKEKNLKNIKFDTYDGETFPYKDNFFDVIISRYALHHFPNLIDTFKSIYEMLKNKGLFIISDPTPNINDSKKFVDQFMQMKDDGHIKFYNKSEFDMMLTELGFTYSKSFNTKIRFPRQVDDRYIKLFDSYKKMVNDYEIEIRDNLVYITLNGYYSAGRNLG